MAALIGLLSQKGDVGKGALARLRAWDPAAGWHVKIVDLDFSPASTSRKQRSECAGLESNIAIESFGTIAQGAQGSTVLRPRSHSSRCLVFAL